MTIRRSSSISSGAERTAVALDNRRLYREMQDRDPAQGRVPRDTSLAMVAVHSCD